MRIVLDAMGSDDHPEPEMQAALEAFRLWGEPVLLAGPEPQLQELLERLGGSRGQVQIAHASEVLEMTDKAAGAARGKPNSSMAVGMEQLRIGEAQAFVTAGNTGGAMATALFKLGRIRGVRRPALSPTFPVRGGRTVVIDIGANTECRPEFLVQFAQMGALYSQVMYGVANPRVGLLSNGEEAGKGNLLVRETFPLFEGLGLNFVGNLEPKEVYQGAADVVVTDGFTGNVFLKTSEAVASMLVDTLREEIRTASGELSAEAEAVLVARDQASGRSRPYRSVATRCCPARARPRISMRTWPAPVRRQSARPASRGPRSGTALRLEMYRARGRFRHSSPAGSGPRL